MIVVWRKDFQPKSYCRMQVCASKSYYTMIRFNILHLFLFWNFSLPYSCTDICPPANIMTSSNFITWTQPIDTEIRNDENVEWWNLEVTIEPGRRLFYLCFSESVAGYKTTLAPPLGHSSVPARSRWFLGRLGAHSSRSRSWGPRWPAAWSWCVVFVFSRVHRRQTPWGSAGLSDSSAPLRPATSPGRAWVSERFSG